MLYINALTHGGAERVMINLASKFVANGDVIILVTTYQGEQEYAFSDNIYRKVLSPKKNEPSYIGKLKQQYCILKKLRNLIKSEKPDVIISFLPKSNCRSIIAGMGLNVKKIVSVRNDPKHEYPNSIYRFIAKMLYLFADGVVFQTEDAKKFFPNKIQKKSRIIMNQVDTRFFDNQFEGKRHDIVAVGRLEEQKNFELLIRAFIEIAQYTKDNLYIYGEGNLREKLQKIIDDAELNNRIYLPGITEDVAETIKHAKMFVLSSDYEGMPNALLEALALGLPCVATDCPCGGPKTLIEHGVNGLLVPVNNPHELNAAMQKLLDDEQYAQQIGQEAALRAKQYSPEKIFQQWNDYVGEILS